MKITLSLVILQSKHILFFLFWCVKFSSAIILYCVVTQSLVQPHVQVNEQAFGKDIFL